MLTFVFVFKQETAYEMRISEWSSDVCSSDLAERDIDRAAGGVFPLRLLAALDRLDGVLDQVGERLAYLAAVAGHHQGLRWRRVAELHLRLRRALQEYSLLEIGRAHV